MIDFINNLAKKFFGSKADKDIEEIQPYVEQINEFSNALQNVSDDALRGKTAEFKQRIGEFLSVERKQIDELTVKAEDPATDVEEKEKMYEQIDKIEETVTEKIEEVLLEILPDAFAVPPAPTVIGTEFEDKEIQFIILKPPAPPPPP